MKVDREKLFRAGLATVGSDFDECDKMFFTVLGVCPDKLVNLFPDCPGLAVQRGTKRAKFESEDEPVGVPKADDLTASGGKNVSVAAVGGCACAGSSESESLLALHKIQTVCTERRVEFYDLQCQLARMEIAHREVEMKREEEQEIREAEERRALREEKARVRKKEEEREARKEKECAALKEKKRAERKLRDESCESRDRKRKEVSLKVNRRGQLVRGREIRDKNVPASSDADKKM